MMLERVSCGRVFTASAALAPGLRHAHVERAVTQEGEAALGLVDLHGGDADVEHHAVDGLASQRLHVGEAALAQVRRPA